LWQPAVKRANVSAGKNNNFPGFFIRSSCSL
jgi:hypothetical protein